MVVDRPGPTPRWPLAGAGALRVALLEAYGDAARGYHDLGHLAEVVDRLDELASHGERFDELPVHLAAWFHDAVYDTDPEPEERSAAWAREALAGRVDPPVTAEVERLVRLTAGHRVQQGDANGAALCDADLGVLAAPHARYATYAADVRREHAHLTDAEFAAGRAAVLRELVARRWLFATTYGRAQWEEPARDNISRELAELG